MRFLVCLPLLLLMGCDPARPELEDILRDYEAQLRGMQSAAQSMADLRRELDDAKRGLVADPSGTARAKLTFRRRTLPPIGSFEGAESARLRAHIAQTELRLVELERLLGELDSMRARQAELNEKRKVLSEPVTPAP